MDRQSVEQHVRDVAYTCAARLREAGIATEELAELIPSRRVIFWTRPATMQPVSQVWRLGVLLVDVEGVLYAAGHLTRAAERGRPGYQSVSREERREIAAAALRGGFPAGTAVNYDARALSQAGPQGDPLGEGSPLGLADGAVRVRWRAGAPVEGAVTLEEYLDERVRLLIEPPQ